MPCLQYVVQYLQRRSITTVNPKESSPQSSRSATQSPRQHAASSGQGTSSLHTVANGGCTQQGNISHRRSAHHILSQFNRDSSCQCVNTIHISWYIRNVGKYLHEELEQHRWNSAYRAAKQNRPFVEGYTHALSLTRQCVQFTGEQKKTVLDSDRFILRCVEFVGAGRPSFKSRTNVEHG